MDGVEGDEMQSCHVPRGMEKRVVRGKWGRGSREPTYPSHTHTHAVRLSFCARTPLLLSSAAGGTCLPRACHSVHAAAAMTHPTHLRKGPGVLEGEKEGKGVVRLIFLSDADEINTVKSGKIV